MAFELRQSSEEAYKLADKIISALVEADHDTGWTLSNGINDGTERGRHALAQVLEDTGVVSAAVDEPSQNERGS